MPLRLATLADAPAICAIWNPIIRETVITFNPVEKTVAEVEALLQSRFEAGHASFVFEEEGAVLGFASYGQFRAGLGYARSMEHTIHLATAARGKGLGGVLLSAVLGHAAATGKHAMIGAVTEGNTASLKLHAKHDFHEVGRLPEAGYKFGRYHTLILMQKLLDAPPPEAP